METWIEFKSVGRSPSGKTEIWDVVAKVDGVSLGQIRWHGAWRKYAFFPAEKTLYESKCLRDLATFCDNEMRKRTEEQRPPMSAREAPVEASADAEVTQEQDLRPVPARRSE